MTTADKINAAHAAVEAHTSGALEKARECGELLVLAKKEAGRGSWLAWLKANTTVEERCAQYYMRIAKHWEQLTAGLDPKHVSALTLRGALSFLSDEEKCRAELKPPTPIKEPKPRLPDDWHNLKRKTYLYIIAIAERLAPDDVTQLAEFLREFAKHLEGDHAVAFFAEQRQQGGSGAREQHAPYRAAYRAGVRVTEVSA